MVRVWKLAGAKAIVRFKGCRKIWQELNSADQYQHCEVVFDLEIDGTHWKDLSVDTKQIVGGDFDLDGLEVGPVPTPGDFNYGVFRDTVEEYYKKLVGANGQLFRVTGEASHIRLEDCILAWPWQVQFELGDKAEGGFTEMEAGKVALKMYRNQEFSDQKISIDGGDYKDCTFTKCIIEYSGGSFKLVGCGFHNCQWALSGSAGNTINFLTSLFNMGGQQIVEATFDNIRKGQHPRLPGQK